MPMLMIKCPTTGKALPTLIVIDEESFKNPTNQMTNNSVRCPHCGQAHRWNKEDAFFAEQ